MHLSPKETNLHELSKPVVLIFFKSVLNNSNVRAGGRRASVVGRWGSFQVNFLVNIFSKLHLTFILQWIAFIFDRDEETDQ